MTDTTDPHAVCPGQLRKFTGELGLSFYHGRMFLVIPRDQQNESDKENYSIFIDGFIDKSWKQNVLLAYSELVSD